MGYTEAIAEAQSRLRRGAALRLGVSGGRIGFVSAALAMLLISLFLPQIDHWWGLILLPCGAGLWGLYGWWYHRPSKLDAALALDRSFDLHESLSTALVLAGHERAEVSGVLNESADDRSRTLSKSMIARRMSPTLPWGKLVASFAILVFAGFLFPLLPPVIGSAPTPIPGAAATAKEAQKVRKVARKLEKKSRAALDATRRARLRAARRAAQRLQTTARKLAQSGTRTPRAVARLRSVGDQIRRARALRLGLPGPGTQAQNESDSSLEAIDRAFQQLDRWSAADLERALGEFAAGIEARPGTKTPLDARRLGELRERSEKNAEALEEIAKLLAELNADPKLQEISRRAAEQMRRMAEALENAETQSAETEGEGLDAEQLKALLDQLKSMSPKELNELLKSLAQMDIEQALLDEIEAARGGL